MTMTMTSREVDGVSVVALDGRIVLDAESNDLREKLKSLIAAGKKKIVVNMDHIKYIDSAGLGALVAAYFSARTQSASLRLCHLGSKFRKVLQVNQLQIARIRERNQHHSKPSWSVGKMSAATVNRRVASSNLARGANLLLSFQMLTATSIS
jgi:anti-sigma B factor antagonist